MKSKFTIRKKIIISSIAILLLALSISGSFFFFSYYQIRQEDAYKELDLTISSIEKSISSNFSSLNNLALNFLSTPYIRHWMNNDISFIPNSPKDYATISNMQKEILYTLIFNDAWLQKFVDTAYLFTEGECIPLVSRVNENQLDCIINYQKIKHAELGTYFLAPTTKDANAYYVKKIGNISFDKELTLMISINQEHFAKSLYDLPDDYTVHILDASKKIFFSTEKNTIGSLLQIDISNYYKDNSSIDKQEFLINNTSYLNIIRNIEDTHFYVSISVPKSYINKDLIQSLYYYFFIIIFFILFFTAIALIVVGSYTRIIKDILLHISELNLRNYTVRMPKYKDQQLNTISTTFNNMTEDFQNLINKVYKNEILLKESEIKLLQSQMNPHFLLNTLTTVSTKALMCGDEEIYKMVSALSSLLSTSLYTKQNSFCRIRDELEYIEMYLYIQHIRFEDKLKYSITIEDDSLLNYFIPRLSIEPIVENAVIHGLQDNLTSGIISINIGVDSKDNIIFTIKDNGKGFSVKDILENHNDNVSKRPHIGIYNTNKRLQLIYGLEYGITFESTIDIGTTAFIKMPQMRDLDIPTEV